MQQPTASLLPNFLTGLLAAWPLVATVAVSCWLASFVFSWLGPDSAVGSVRVAVGFGGTGLEVIG